VVAVRLAILEGAAIFLGPGIGILIWNPHPLSDLTDLWRLAVPSLTIAVCCIVAFYYCDLYDLRISHNFLEFAPRLLQSLGLSFLLMAFVYSLVPDLAAGGRPLRASMVVLVAFVLPVRAVSYAILRSRRFAERVVIVGMSALARKIAAEIEVSPDSGYVVTGFVDDTESGLTEMTGLPVLGRLDKLGWIIETARPQMIVVAQSERRNRMPVRELLNARLAGIAVEDGVKVYEQVTRKLAIESLKPSTLIFSPEFRKSRLQLGLRRGIGLAAATGGLVLTAPVMLLIAAIIKLDSRGPVFFTQRRAGKNGREFLLFKFRTMDPGALPTDSVFARDDLSRITRAGRWLRRFHLDELPQFVNILRGDMDFIGPRPEMAGNIPTLVERIPFYPLRFAVRPGVTGWAQIKHGYSVAEEDVVEKMRYDLYYIKHMSLRFDLRILIDTVKIVLFGRAVR
jgi:exopolysaccharide biosynthesis polyprenyl glycosylphosphotransferase